MYIRPDSEIYVLRNVPIEPNYNHTLYFNSLENQLAYFTDPTRVIRHFTDYSRIKLEEGTIMLECPVDTLYDANYIMFRNTAFGPKAFYAFVTNVEYVNNKTTRLYYALDVMQTWFFEHSLGQCFVVREHAATDNPGDNLLPEDLELGEYIYTKYDVPPEYNMFSEWLVFICTNWILTNYSIDNDDISGEDVAGDMTQGLYSGLKWIAFNRTELANDYILKMTKARKSDSIVSVIMLPSVCADIISPNQFPIVETFVPVNYYPNGFTPKNKKLLTAPYTQLLVTDYQGHAAKYNYEYFERDGNTIMFHTMAAISTVPQFILTPESYKGLSKPGEPMSYHESLIIGDIPQCAFNIDSYKAWIAMASNRVGLFNDVVQGGANIISGLMGGSGVVSAGPTVSTALGPTMYNPMPTQAGATTAKNSVGSIISGASQVGQAVARFTDAYMMPPQAKSIGGGSIVFQTGEYGFHYLYTYIREEYARIIDDYFTMYGYKTNRVKVPYVKNEPGNMRPYWNYIKVLNCMIDGSLPVEYEHVLHDIYERGITFWSAPWDVGNYTLDNSPTGG